MEIRTKDQSKSKRPLRQSIRSKIKTETFDKLEINENPSAYSKKIYLSLQKKQLIQGLQEHLTNLPNQSIRSPYQKKRSASVFSSLNSNSPQCSLYTKFCNFQNEKNCKIQAHILKNYDGGERFFKQDNILSKFRKKQQKQMLDILDQQIIEHKQKQEQQRKNKQKEIQYMQEKYNLQTNQEIKTREHLKVVRNEQRMEKLLFIEEERKRKKSRSQFKYNLKVRHNPITNPIEYYISNPYILKKIQDKNMLKI